MQEINKAKISMSLGGKQKREMSPRASSSSGCLREETAGGDAQGPPSQKVPESSSPPECGSHSAL